MNSKNNPTFAHLSVIIHLFGTVRFVFEMSEAERTKFCGVSFDKPLTPQVEDEQTQQPRSAMFTLWNLVADLIETQDQIQNQQQQVTDFYGKTSTTFPRLACLIQLYINAMAILERVKDFVMFAEGDNQDLIINEDFVRNVDMIIKKDYYKYDKTYLSCTEVNQEIVDPMIFVQKEAIVAAWSWYEHHLNIATKLFTIDHHFPSKSMIAPPSISPKQTTLKQLIMYLDFNIFPLSAISVKHPVTEKTGIIKNRPALGERALQELMNDHLLKFNYFLTDTRGRNVKSYMKAPIPPGDDPTRDQFIKNLLKHDIDVNEYCSIYESSAIPPNNNLSNLTLEIFEHSTCFVNEYSKYQVQLNIVIRKHIENCVVREVEQGNFIIQNANAFTRQFHHIESLVLGAQPNQVNGKRQSLNIINQANKSTVQSRHTTAPIVNVFHDTVEKSQETQRDSPIKTSCDRRDTDITGKLFLNLLILYIYLSFFIKTSMGEGDDLLGDIHNSSIIIREESVEGKDEYPDISTQKSITEITNKYEKVTEQTVKKIMQSIINGKSVIYTKTDLTMICNKRHIRLEAVKRLVEAKLLRYEDNFWVEPTRARKQTEKDSKRILRPGWLKNCPASNSNVSKFDFIQSLQKHVNLSYDDFLKAFYPHQKENIFTNNNWTLSDELLEIFQSNIFYKEHVRYNIQRFRPGDVMTNELGVENQLQTSLTPISHLNNFQETTTNDNPQEMLQRQIIDNNSEEEDMVYTCPLSTGGKRKIGSNINFQEYPRRIQPRRMKKN
ncbi:unnamed protein product [Rotaria sordida]|uniref:Uncharacterized protein n=1 Tax=Rotaria sordida TaxID=392033 RepID=A0A815PT62_9BILA|nr:unnamed protein product [Rotaria sordida]